MSDRNRPDVIGKFATDAGASKTAPASAKATEGMYDNEFLPSDYVNHFQNTNGQFNDYTAGLPREMIVPGIQSGLKVHWDSGIAPGGEFSIYGEDYAITTGSTASNYMETNGDIRARLFVGQYLVIDGSTGGSATGNDGTYTIATIALSGADTRITFEESVPSGAYDGSIYTGGTFLSREGTKIEIAAQMHYNDGTGIKPANAVAPGAARTDYIVLQYNNESNTLLFPAVLEATSPDTLDYVVATISANVSGGNYVVERISNGARPFEAKNIIFVGDGISSFHSEILDEDAPLQDALFKCNQRGGGIVYMSGSFDQRITANVFIPSLVTLSGTQSLYTTVFYAGIDILGFVSSPGSSTIAGTNTVNISSGDIKRSGVGSELIISTGADAGTYYISEVLSDISFRVVYITASGTPVDAVFSGTTGVFCSSTVSKASLSSISINGNVSITNAKDIIISNVFVDNTRAAPNATIEFNGSVDNILISGVVEKTNLSGESIGDTLAFAGTKTFISSCSFLGNVIFVGSVSGTWGTNRVGGTLTIPDAMLPDIQANDIDLIGDITLKDNKRVILGTGGDAEIYYDGTDLIVKSDVVGSGNIVPKSDVAFPDYFKIIMGTGGDSEMFFDGDSLNITKIPLMQYDVSATSANLSIASGAYEIVDYNIPDIYYASGSNSYEVTIGSAWKYTAHRNMYVDVSARISLTGTHVASKLIYLAIYKGGIFERTIARITSVVSGSSVTGIYGNAKVHLLSGENIDIRVYQNSGNVFTMNVLDKISSVSIKEISSF